jgi:hypothetical protein
MKRSWWVGVAAATALAAVVVYRRIYSTVRRIQTLIHKSVEAHTQGLFAESLAAAIAASCLAAEELTGSPMEVQARMHLSGVYHAQQEPGNALNEIDKALAIAEIIHGANAHHLVPILHARAEVLEAAGRPLADAASDMARARDIRRATNGENSLDASRASFNLASILVRGAQEAGLSEARREALLERASSLTLEASSVAVALDAADDAADFLDQVLSLIDNDDGLDDVVTTMRQRLRDAYLEVAGEEWEAGEGVEERAD